MARTTFDVRGIEPASDPAWFLAGDSVRRDFWRAVVLFVKDVKDDELAAGLDRRGRPLLPIAESTRKNRVSAMGPADPSAPPLMPAYAVSRTRLWFQGKAFADHATFGWRNGWGRVLAYHRSGKGPKGRKRPKRDVIGLSDKSLAKVKRLATAWWKKETAGGVKAVRLPQPLPAPQAKPLRATGSTDYQHYTFGIGGEGPPLPGWQATGFSSRGPDDRGLPALGGPGTYGPAWDRRRPAPRPRTAQAPAYRFTPEPGLGRDYVTVWVDVAKVEAEMSGLLQVGPGGVGGIDDRYQRFGEFAATGKAIEQPRAYIDAADRVAFSNGRHRWAWLRDHGVTEIPVSVRRAQAAEIRRRFGS